MNNANYEQIQVLLYFSIPNISAVIAYVLLVGATLKIITYRDNYLCMLGIAQIYPYTKRVSSYRYPENMM